MLGFLAAGAGALIGGLVGGGATIVSSLVHGHGFPSWSAIGRGALKGAMIGGIGVGLAFFGAAVLGVALPTMLASVGAGLLASAAYSFFFKHRTPSLETLGAGAVGGAFAGLALSLALGAVGFMGLGSVAGAIAAPAGVVGGSVAGGELAKEEMNYRQAMDEEKKTPPPAPIVVPGDSTQDPPAPSRSKGIAGSLAGH